MQRQELCRPKVNAATRACESDKSRQTRDHKKGSSFENTGQEKAVWWPADTAHPIRPKVVSDSQQKKLYKSPHHFVFFRMRKVNKMQIKQILNLAVHKEKETYIPLLLKLYLIYLEGISNFLLPHPPRPFDTVTKFCMLTKSTCVAYIQQ